MAAEPSRRHLKPSLGQAAACWTPPARSSSIPTGSACCPRLRPTAWGKFWHCWSGRAALCRCRNCWATPGGAAWRPPTATTSRGSSPRSSATSSRASATATSSSRTAARAAGGDLPDKGLLRRPSAAVADTCACWRTPAAAGPPGRPCGTVCRPTRSFPRPFRSGPGVRRSGIRRGRDQRKDSLAVRRRRGFVPLERRR